MTREEAQMLFDRSKTEDTLEVYVHCAMCQTRFTLHMTEKEIDGFKHSDRNIQDILPRLSRDERELLLSRICPTCFDEIFKDEE